MLKIKENIGKSILKLTLEKIFIGNDIRSIGKKKKKKRQMGLYKTKKLLHNKENN